MSDLVTLDLPPDPAQRARAVATQSQRAVEDVLLEWLDRASTDVPVEALLDDQVVALCDQQMDEQEQHDLSALLARQREGEMDVATRRRLDALTNRCRRGMVRKAQALNVAVGRGLRAPLG